MCELLFHINVSSKKTHITLNQYLYNIHYTFIYYIHLYTANKTFYFQITVETQKCHVCEISFGVIIILGFKCGNYNSLRTEIKASFMLIKCVYKKLHALT